MNNNLVLHIENVIEKADLYQNSNKLKELAANINNFDNKLNDVNIIHKRVVAIQKNALKQLKTNNSLNNICKEIKGMIKQLKLDNYNTSSIYRVKRDLLAIENNLDKQWSEYINSEIGSMKAIVSTISSLITGMDEVIQLNRLNNRINSSPSASETSYNAIEEYKNIYNKLIEKISFDDNILAFMKKLTSNKRITLSDLNTDVFKWLNEHGFSEKINLVINEDNRRYY